MVMFKIGLKEITQTKLRFDFMKTSEKYHRVFLMSDLVSYPFEMWLCEVGHPPLVLTSIQTCAKNLISNIKSIGNMVILRKTTKIDAILKICLILTK